MFVGSHLGYWYTLCLRTIFACCALVLWRKPVTWGWQLGGARRYIDELWREVNFAEGECLGRKCPEQLEVSTRRRISDELLVDAKKGVEEFVCLGQLPNLETRGKATSDFNSHRISLLPQCFVFIDLRF
jgi:hypothetical protein